MKKNEKYRITPIDRPKNNIQKIFVLDNQNEVMLADDYFCIISNYRLFKIELLTRDCIISNVVLRHVSDMVLFKTRKFGWAVTPAGAVQTMILIMSISLVAIWLFYPPG